MVTLNLPTRQSIPQWLGIVTMFVVMLPVILINGTYTGSTVEVSNTLGILSEDISMGYYATSVGMAVAYPLVMKVISLMTTKTLILADLAIQIVLSLCCAATNNILIIILCSFFVGLLKAFILLEFTMLIRPLFSPKNVRSEFYAYFYPIMFAGGQLSMILTAILAYHYQWQHMYYFTAILMMVAMIMVMITFRYGRRPKPLRIGDIDWRSLLLAAAAMLMCIYVFTYGKTLDWFSSPVIVLFCLLTPLLGWLFVHRQSTHKKPYVSLKPLGHRKSIVGYLFMAIVMFLTSTSMLVTSYMNSIIRVDNVHSNTLYLLLIPGFVVGAVICFWWFRWQKWRFRYLIAGGMFCYVIYLAILYFGVTPYGTYEMLFLPTFFRGLGMLVLFIAFGVYVVEDMEPQLMLSNAFFLISFRSVLAPVISASVFSNILYRMQAKNLTELSDNITMTAPMAAERYGQALKGAAVQGYGTVDAARIATNNLFSTLQQQALLVSIKTILGYVLIFALVTAVVCCFIPFHKTVKVAVVKTGNDMV